MGPSVKESEKADDQKHLGSNNLSNIENVTGCCQGVNSVSCCRNASFEKNNGVKETAETHKKYGCKSWSWFEKLDNRDILTGVAVVGAVAATAVAYKFYRRSG